ncbi:hypothetical protein OS493_014092 [Desmophyllum pertusum]|uniref:FCS-type domain-containing protein n=1 Tax=Desmophyllum pertusum TaxID=174260 RepID=A0A9W9ZFI1_9CNID|nr:hypothetical protein OS493_014092 [Desmophyllum pertusum]
MEMVANTLHLDQVGRASKRSASPRILTHFVEGFVIQESNYPFTSGDDTEEVNQDQLNGNQDYENGDLDMDMDVGFEADSPSSNDEAFNDVFVDDSGIGHCEQCGRLTENPHHRGPKRFCSTSCARRYSVSCSRKMVAFHARTQGGRHSSANQLASDYSLPMYYDQQPGPYMVDASIQVNEFGE